MTDIELSPREIDVLRLICNGLNLKEIAQHMHLSIKTVSAHRFGRWKSWMCKTTASFTR
ncbi:response regulator transcription factor [Enterobacter hormaechei]